MSDVLSTQSRMFYERTKSKLTVSLVVAAAGLMLLGFCSYSGGMAASFNTQISQLKANTDITDDFSESAANQQVGGYGFATFCYLAGCILLFAAAIYVSPLLCGSANEKKMIRAPTEIESGYAPYSENEKV